MAVLGMSERASRIRKNRVRCSFHATLRWWSSPTQIVHYCLSVFHCDVRQCRITALTTILTGAQSYVLLQVRKGDNQSNVDALIHKVVPSTKFDKIADTARKQFDNYKRYHVKNREDVEGKGLESIVLAINSGASDNELNGKTDAFDKIINKITTLLKVSAMKVLPKYRSKLEKFHIKPEIVHFRSGKPSVMFEINTKEVIKSIQDILASRSVRKYTDKVANKAAFIYRTVRDEIMQE